MVSSSVTSWSHFSLVVSRQSTKSKLSGSTCENAFRNRRNGAGPTTRSGSTASSPTPSASIARRRSIRIVGKPTWWSAWMCEIHAHRKSRTFARAVSAPYRRQSWPNDPSPQSTMRPPRVFWSKNKPETLRYFAGMDEPVPRKTSSTSPGLSARSAEGTSSDRYASLFSVRLRATASKTSRSSRTLRATSARGIALMSSPAASSGTSVNRLKLHPGCVNTSCVLNVVLNVVLDASKGDASRDSSLALASLAAASASARACASATARSALRGSGKTSASIACSRALTAAAERNTHAPPVASEWTIRWRGRSNGFVPSPTARNAPHVSIQRAYAALVATAAGARCTTTARRPSPSPAAPHTSPNRLPASEVGSASASRCSSVGTSTTAKRNPARRRATTSSDRIVRPSGKTTSSPRTSAPRTAPRGTPSASALLASNLPGIAASRPW